MNVKNVSMCAGVKSLINSRRCLRGGACNGIIEALNLLSPLRHCGLVKRMMILVTYRCTDRRCAVSSKGVWEGGGDGVSNAMMLVMREVGLVISILVMMMIDESKSG